MYASALFDCELIIVEDNQSFTSVVGVQVLSTHAGYDFSLICLLLKTVNNVLFKFLVRIKV